MQFETAADTVSIHNLSQLPPAGYQICTEHLGITCALLLSSILPSMLPLVRPPHHQPGQTAADSCSHLWARHAGCPCCPLAKHEGWLRACAGCLPALSNLHLAQHVPCSQVSAANPALARSCSQLCTLHADLQVLHAACMKGFSEHVEIICLAHWPVCCPACSLQSSTCLVHSPCIPLPPA